MAAVSLKEWAGDDRATLAIIFTDIVGSTALEEEIKAERMKEVRQSHFKQSRKLITQFKGREIKTIGDSFMVVFRSVEKSLDYALAIRSEPGDSLLQVRAGIHIGPMEITRNDVFGRTVNYAGRVVGAIDGAAVYLSDRAKEDIDICGAARHAELKWERHEHDDFNGLPGTHILWSLTMSARE